MTIKQIGGIFGRNPAFNEVGGTLTTAAQPNITSLGTQSSDLAFASGNGIDFSATSGAGTSELFDDYEEGTWTPALNAYDGTPTVSGYYVKIGQMVYIECSITLDGTSDASGYIIKSLPFSVASPELGGGAINNNTGGEADIMVGYDVNGRIRLSTSSNGNQTYNSIGVSSTIKLNAQYRAA